MRIRSAVVLATACVIAAAPLAQAAPVPCNVVTDAKGDATQFYILAEGSAPNDPALDIVSMDYGSNAKQMTTVVRVDKLAKSSSTSPYGFTWYAYFNAGGVEFFTQASSSPQGDTFSVGYVNSTGIRSSLTNGAATGVLDLAKNEIRTTFNLEQLAEQATVKARTKLSGLRGLTNRFLVRIVLQADAAEGAKSHTVGSRTCVVVGK